MARLTRGQKNRLTRLAKRESVRMKYDYFQNIPFDSLGITPWYHTRGVRLENAVKKRNYRGMLQFTPVRKLRAAGVV